MKFNILDNNFRDCFIENINNELRIQTHKYISTELNREFMDLDVNVIYSNKKIFNIHRT